MSDTLIIEGDTRKPLAGFLTYPGRIDVPVPYAPKGPNTLGELLWPVTYDLVDLEDGMVNTRVGFSYTAPTADYMADA